MQPIEETRGEATFITSLLAASTLQSTIKCCQQRKEERENREKDEADEDMESLKQGR